MKLITAAEAPAFDNDHARFIGLAAPSRGATENAAWRLTLLPGTDGPAHALTREEIFIALAGRMTVTMDEEVLEVAAGDALVVPAHQLFRLANDGDQPFEALVVLPVGGQGYFPGQEPFVAPWAR